MMDKKKDDSEIDLQLGVFAENELTDNKKDTKRVQKAQKKADKIEISTERAIDKKLVEGFIRSEKRQLKESRKTEKAALKAYNKSRKEKIKALYKEKRKEDKIERQKKEAILRDIEKRGKFASWFRLDNAASIYPSAADKNWNFVFRISATLNSEVNPELLQKAVDDILPRFPSFNVRLCHGFFWNYYERNFGRLIVEKETTFPCQPFNLRDSEGFLLRVLYSKYKVILEVFHAISDGRGALFFLNSLLARYFELSNIKITNFVGCTSVLDLPSDQEVEDSFFAACNDEKSKRPKERAAYKIRGNLLPAGTINTIEGEMSAAKVKEVAGKYNATITEFLAAVVGYCIYKKRKSTKKPPRISVTIDLRPWYNSKTMRNFSSYKNVDVFGDDLTFEETVALVKEGMKFDKSYLQSNINSNVKIQKNGFVKIMPLFIKNLILKACFNFMGENYQTLSLSNLGKISVPEEFNDRILNYNFNLGRSLHNEKSIGVVTFKDNLNICISSKLYETETERDIFKMLADMGIDVKVYSNRRDLYER